MNDDDRKLLELAAKAAGAKPYDWNTSRNGLFISNGVPMLLAGGDPDGDWNPLADDGQALGLAVKLHIGIRSHGADHWCNPSSTVALYELGESAGRVTVKHGEDPYFSTRRAIVRAAAEIGKLQP